MPKQSSRKAKSQTSKPAARSPAPLPSGSSSKKLFEIRDSGIHGRGGFALTTIPKETPIVEYKGDIITWAEVWRRYPDDESAGEQNHTFLFEIDDERVIDATARNFPAKWINHSCDPNCIATGEGDRIWIESLRTIRPGEELTYDYKITLQERHTPAVKARYQCRCGKKKCRGTILAPKR